MKPVHSSYSVNDVPDKAVAFDVLAPLFPIWNHTYEVAIGKARAHFQDRGRTINRYLFPCIVRDEMLAELPEQQLAVPFQHCPLENNGLLLLYQGYVIRSRKTKHGQLAAPGRSWALQSFYRQLSWEEGATPPPWVPQQLTLQFPPSPPEYNLMLLWCVDHRFIFEGLWLAAPRYADANTVKCHWCEPIPYLGAQSVAIPQQTAITEVPDLDNIELDTGEANEDDEDEEGETGTGQSE